MKRQTNKQDLLFVLIIFIGLFLYGTLSQAQQVRALSKNPVKTRSNVLIAGDSLL